MKMRLNFARCLLHDPEMYFLDEPTTGLDPINAGRIKELIRELQQRGKTIFLTTHNMFDADQLCDRVALIHQGALCALDSPARLKLAHGQSECRSPWKTARDPTTAFLWRVSVPTRNSWS